MKTIEHPAGVLSTIDMLCIACLRSLGDDQPLLYQVGDAWPDYRGGVFGPLCPSCAHPQTQGVQGFVNALAETEGNELEVTLGEGGQIHWSAPKEKP